MSYSVSSCLPISSVPSFPNRSPQYCISALLVMMNRELSMTNYVIYLIYPFLFRLEIPSFFFRTNTISLHLHPHKVYSTIKVINLQISFFFGVKFPTEETGISIYETHRHLLTLHVSSLA